MASSEGLLLDTHVIVWMATGDPRLGRRLNQDALLDPSRPFYVSAVVGFELADLQQRGRIAMTESLDILRDKMDLHLVDLPAGCWAIAARLPAIHRDPVDRMLIAHALAVDMTLVTADKAIRQYPVPLLQ